ncbi:MAG: hypothetical protein PHU27_02840 [Salinivirgaceae bacterium]|nr:hypothetical protein [Salinivirgaceae bacterium]MDD4746411.1 hypothetical protein [Salinivirgaceae bacterium]MDY0279708.1 hypothetical protein [Salinivirgaceae bacterium]
MKDNYFVDLKGTYTNHIKQLALIKKVDRAKIVTLNDFSNEPLIEISDIIKKATNVVFFGHETLSTESIKELYNLAQESRAVVLFYNEYGGTIPDIHNATTEPPYHTEIVIHTIKPEIKLIRTVIEFALYAEKTDLATPILANAITSNDNEINALNFRLSFQNGSTVNATIQKSRHEDLIINFANSNGSFHKTINKRDLWWLFSPMETTKYIKENQLTPILKELSIRNITEGIEQKISNRIAIQ